MGPCLGTIVRLAKKISIQKLFALPIILFLTKSVLAILPFTKYFTQCIDAFVTMSKKVLVDLKQFSAKPAQQVLHPLYDNFGDIISKQEAREHLGLNPADNIILFFGFIRSTKGWIYCLKQ